MDIVRVLFVWFFFFNDTATTEIYTLSLHDALPILRCGGSGCSRSGPAGSWWSDRKSTRLKSSHGSISYAVFCLKKKQQTSQLHSRQTVLLPHLRATATTDTR